MKNIALLFSLFFISEIAFAAQYTKDTKFVHGIGTDTTATIEIDKSGSTNPALKWDASDSKWKFSHDGVTFQEMGSGSGGGGGIDSWTTATVYAVDLLVVESNKIYKCLELHTSGTFATDLADGKWQLIESEASVVSVVPAGNLVAEDVQSALEELQGEIDTNSDDILTLASDIADLDSTYATDAELSSGLSSKQDASTAATDAELSAGLALKQDASAAATDTELSDGLALKQDAATAATDSELTSGLALKADIASPTFTGDPKAPTASGGDNDTSIATTAFVTSAVSTGTSGAVLTTTDQSISGLKTFTGQIQSTSTTQGARPCPQMTNAQMLAVATPGNGECVYNTTFLQNMIYDSVGWVPQKLSPWVTGFSYKADTIVENNGKLYKCISAHVSGTFSTDLATKWASVSESSPGNLLTNWTFDFATVTTGWTCSNTGTATATITADNGQPIPGEANHLKVVCSGGASGGTCKCIQSPSTAAGFNTYIGAYVRSEVGVPAGSMKLYSLVNGSRVTTMDFSNSGSGSAFWEPKFVNEVSGSTSTGIEVEATVAASNSGTFYVDKAEVTLGSNIVPASIVAGWQSCTVTGSWVTNTTYTCKYRQNGSNADFNIKAATSGAPTSATLSITLPNSWSIDTSKINTATDGIFMFPSDGVCSDSNSRTCTVKALYKSATEVYLSQDLGNGNTGSITQASPFTFGNGDFAEVTFTAPISQLQSQTNVFTSQCGAACRESFSAKISSAGVVSDEPQNGDWINGNCTVSATATYTCPLVSTLGLTSKMNCTVTTDNSAPLNITVSIDNTTSTTSQVVYHTSNSSTGAANARPVTISCEKAGADALASRIIQGSFANMMTVPGISKPEHFSFSFGTTNTSTVCSGSPCFVSQSGSAISSVTRSGTGIYALNTVKTYSKLSCYPGVAISSTGDNAWIRGYIGSVSSIMECSNCSSIAFRSIKYDHLAALDVFGTIFCVGQAP